MKSDLRYKFKIKRKYFQHSAREVACGAICDNVTNCFADKESFFVYFSFGSEADTHALCKALLAAGKRVYLPRVEGQDIVAVPYFGDEGALIENKYGIAEPTGEAFEGDIDVCVTPLLAVNERGYRLGYGGGYYDRYFAAHPDIIKAGVGFYLQMTDEPFEEEGDVPLDIYICEKGIYTFGRES